MSTTGADGEGWQQDPFEAFTGDRASAARLRSNLTTIAQDNPGTHIASIANEVLAGRRPIRDLADDAEFSDVLAVGIDDYREYLASLTSDERAEMVKDAKSAQSPG